MFTSRHKEDAPDWIQDYWSLPFKLPASTALDDVEFCCLDCETTGLDKYSRVISLGAVKISRRKIHVSDVLDLRFAVAKGAKQSEIHEELARESTAENEEQLRELLAYVGNAVIVGHHIAFDISKINQLIGSHWKGFSLKNRSADTWHLMKRLDPMRFERNVGGTQSRSLDALCTEFDIDIENRHTALGDAYMTAQLFVRLLQGLKKRKVLKVNQL